MLNFCGKIMKHRTKKNRNDIKINPNGSEIKHGKKIIFQHE